MSIPFTQYLLPHGKKVENSIDMPADVEQKAHHLIEQGCHFDIEILINGQVSMTCERERPDGETELLSIQICDNGPVVPTMVRTLVETAYLAVG